MAAGLNCRLSGPRSYGEREEHHPWVNGAAPDPDAATIGKGLAMLTRGLLVTGAVLLMLAALD